MAHERILTIKAADGKRYGVDGWESTQRSSPSPEYKYPGCVQNLEDSTRLDRWETADRELMANNTVAPLKTAVEGLERLVIDCYVEPEVVTITRHAPFSADALADAVDLDAEFVDSKERSIRK